VITEFADGYGTTFHRSKSIVGTSIGQPPIARATIVAFRSANVRYFREAKGDNPFQSTSFFLVLGSAWNANRKRLCLVMFQMQALRRQEPQMPRIPRRAWNQNNTGKKTTARLASSIPLGRGRELVGEDAKRAVCRNKFNGLVIIYNDDNWPERVT